MTKGYRTTREHIDYEKEYEPDRVLFDRYWKNGKREEDRNILVMKYQRMAAMAALTMNTSNAVMDTDDIAQQSILYLIKAIEKYRPDSGTEFGTYLFNVVQNNMRTANAYTAPIKMPFTMYAEIVKIKGAMEAKGIKKCSCSAKDIKTISAATGIKEDRIKKLLASPQFDMPVSLSLPIYKDETGSVWTLDDSLRTESVEGDVVERVYMQSFMERVNDIMTQIENDGTDSEKRNIKIVRMRCGFNSEQRQMTFAEIAAEIGVSTNKVTVYYQRTLNMLKKKLYKFETA